MASKIACPKCAEQVAAGAVICTRCDYVLDTSFLGEDIFDEISGDSMKTDQVAPIDASASEDAVMVGDIDDEADLLFSEATGSFLTADTADVVRRIAPATVYVSKSVQEQLQPEAVLGPVEDIEQRKSALSPFELYVLSFLDGQRPVARVRKKSGLSSDDVRIALAMLIEKKAIKLVGHVAKPKLSDLFSDDEKLGGDTIDESSPLAVDVAQQAQKQTNGEWKEPVVQVAPLPQAVLARSPWQGDTAAKQPAESTMEENDKLYSRPPVRVIEVEKREAQARARGFFELAHSELQKGNRVRAHMYARLAAETDPEEPKYQEL